VRFEGPTIMGLGGIPIVVLFTTGVVLFTTGVVLFTTGVVLFTTGVVLFTTGAGVTFNGWLVGGGDDSDDGIDGGDSDDGGWPVDGMNGMFELNCAKAMLIQLAIVAIPIAIIVETKRMPFIFYSYILYKDAANMSYPKMGKARRFK
jgi:hypothetical protein